MFKLQLTILQLCSMYKHSAPQKYSKISFFPLSYTEKCKKHWLLFKNFHLVWLGFGLSQTLEPFDRFDFGVDLTDVLYH